MSKKKELLIWTMTVPVAVFVIACVVGGIYENLTGTKPQSAVIVIEAFYAIYIALAIVICNLFRRELAQSLAASGKKLFLKVLIYSALALLLSAFSGYVLSLFDIPTTSNQEILDRAARIAPVSALIVSVICAPIVEEILFRFTFQVWVKGKIKVKSHRIAAAIAVLCSGLLFGLFHAGPSVELIPYVVAGVFLGTVYEKTGSIALVILVHAIQNCVAHFV